VVKLYLDADVDVLVEVRLRQRGYDAVAAREAGMARAGDPDQLAYASAGGRALPAFNTRDYVPLYRQWWREQRPHAGIIVSRRYDRPEIGELLRLIENVLQFATDDDLANRLRYLSEFDVYSAARAARPA
jgi:hypothetical protein